MSAVLTQHAYGKSRVRLTKILRHAGRHELKELCVAVQLTGDVGASYTHGDNSRIVATDAMKNTVYVLAKDHPLTDIESFGEALAGHFLRTYPHVATATVTINEQPWQRIVINGKEHPHAFVGGSGERRTCTVTLTRQEQRVESGFEELALLKTTDSAFTGFLRDSYTTLPEAEDRIFATLLTATWFHDKSPDDWNHCYQLIRQTLVEVFAGHKSLSVQHTLHAMGAAALEACSSIRQINLQMPNRHHLLVNLQPFGLSNHNEVFVPTDEPFGLISATLTRGS
jgi:urate oxidase